MAFGAGLNTALEGLPNHHVIPQEFKVKITKAKLREAHWAAVDLVEKAMFGLCPFQIG